MSSSTSSLIESVKALYPCHVVLLFPRCFLQSGQVDGNYGSSVVRVIIEVDTQTILFHDYTLLFVYNFLCDLVFSYHDSIQIVGRTRSQVGGCHIGCDLLQTVKN